MSRTVYLDGAYVPEAEATLSIYDLSVMQAAAAFEMTRSFGGEHFRLQDHLNRLVASCDLLGIPWPDGDVKSVINAVTKCNDHGPGEEHRLLMVVSPGCAPIYSDMEGTISHPYIYIADFPLRYTVQGFGRYFTDGVHAVTSTIHQVPDACVPSQAKHRSRLHFHLAQQQAPPGTWPLLMDAQGMYTEAPGANLVMVVNGLVIPGRHNCLRGISLSTVLELTQTPLRRHLVDVTLAQADEVWLTGTPFCMLPVVSLDGKPIGDGTIGPVYKQTLTKWSALVGVDIMQQILDWDTYGPGPRDSAQYARWAADKEFLRGKVWTPDVERARAAKH